MKVYRLERKGVGPFIGRMPRLMTVNQKQLKKINHVRNQVNMPLVSFWVKHEQAVKHKDHMFGASSKEMLKAYFGYKLKGFFQEGYKIKAYEVPEHEVINMGLEVAFPVKYHKLKSVKRVQKMVKQVQRI